MLKNFVKGIADAIRRKEGSSDLISPMDFAQRIDNLQVGGGTDESSIEYVDASSLSADNSLFFSLLELCGAVKMIVDGKLILQKMYMGVGEKAQFKVDLEEKVLRDEYGLVTNKQALEIFGEYDAYMALPRITKEQFYNLNA